MITNLKKLRNRRTVQWDRYYSISRQAEGGDTIERQRSIA